MADPARKLPPPVRPEPANDTEAPLPPAVERAFVTLLLADFRRRPPPR